MESAASAPADSAEPSSPQPHQRGRRRRQDESDGDALLRRRPSASDDAPAMSADDSAVQQGRQAPGMLSQRSPPESMTITDARAFLPLSHFSSVLLIYLLVVVRMVVEKGARRGCSLRRGRRRQRQQHRRLDLLRRPTKTPSRPPPTTTKTTKKKIISVRKKTRIRWAQQHRLHRPSNRQRRRRRATHKGPALFHFRLHLLLPPTRVGKVVPVSAGGSSAALSRSGTVPCNRDRPGT
jgi:hypothetical protein